MVDARIAEVTVFSDRARVRRRGRATRQGGRRDRAASRSLPGAVFLDTIRVSATGGARAARRGDAGRARAASIAQAAKLLDALDAVDDRLVELEDRRVAERLGGRVPACAPPAPRRCPRRSARAARTWSLDVAVVVEGARLPRRAHARAPATGCSKMDVDQRRARARSAIGCVADVAGAEPGRLLGPGRRRGRDRRRDGRRRWAPSWSWSTSCPARAGSRPTTFTTRRRAGRSASRRPRSSSRRPARTGPTPSLLLSTAMPGRGIDLPELLTWTLGERSEFVPQLAAAPARRRPRRRCRFRPRDRAAARQPARSTPRWSARGWRRRSPATAAAIGPARSRPRRQKNAANYQEQVRRCACARRAGRGDD